jgi:pyruvate carboxylase
MRSVAIYSPADRLAQHRYKADESYCVGEKNTPVGAYLDIEDIVATAKANGVDAIHPGYGFLSENATFARRCEEEGIQFVGPSHVTLRDMGDKTRARTLATECGIPVCPGTADAVSDIVEVQDFVQRIGYPVILKAAMGGGGRGMRVVRTPGELVESFNRASSEAKAAFGDGRMFVERYVEGPRHIEVQILADHYGGVVHLGERDCSVQRRHQKVVEMAPAVHLDPVVRARLHADAVKLARHGARAVVAGGLPAAQLTRLPSLCVRQWATATQAPSSSWWLLTAATTSWK